MTESVTYELVTITAEEAGRLEEEFLNGLDQAQDAFAQIIDSHAWAALGHESFVAWWQNRVMPVMTALSMRPSPDLIKRVLEHVRMEEAALPPAQRRRERELAELVGGTRDQVRERPPRSTSGGNPPDGDLDTKATTPTTPASAPEQDQPDPMPAEALPPGSDDDVTEEASPSEAEGVYAPEAGGTPGAPQHAEDAPGAPPSGNGETPERLARRKPIPDAFRDAVYQLKKDVERIERIVLDDRWPRNAEKVGPGSRNDLQRALDLLTAVVKQANK